MKKTTKRLLALACMGAMVLTGCSSIQSINNESDSIIYNGGAVVSVSDHLIYSNGFASGVSDYDTTSNTAYNTAKEYSYLSRMDMENFVGDKYTNDNSNDVLDNRVTGFGNSYMFVVGDYVYYTTPNTHKTSENKYVWKYVSIYKTSINGGSTKEIYTTKSFDADKAIFRAISYNNKNYFVVYEGTNLVVISLNNDKVTNISTKATSVALPEENENWNGMIYYTEDRDSDFGQTGNCVYKADIETGKQVKIGQENGITITMVGRVENHVFYTKTKELTSDYVSTYIIDMDEKSTLDFISSGKQFYGSEISDIVSISKNDITHKGYLFSVTVESGDDSYTEVKYYNNYEAQNNSNYEAKTFLNKDIAYADTVAVFNGLLYYVTDEGIFSKSVITNAEETIVSDITIQVGQYGYDFAYVDGEISRINNIYFYAQNIEEESEDETTEEDESEDDVDENYYLYSVEAKANAPIYLVGKKK